MPAATVRCHLDSLAGRICAHTARVGSGMDAASEGDPNGRDAGGLRAPGAGVDG
jgi:hypothetical protein